MNRTGKKYKISYVNATRTPEERRNYYKLLKEAGYNTYFAKRARDFRKRRLKILLKNKPKTEY